MRVQQLCVFLLTVSLAAAQTKPETHRFRISNQEPTPSPYPISLDESEAIEARDTSKTQAKPPVMIAQSTSEVEIPGQERPALKEEKIIAPSNSDSNTPLLIAAICAGIACIILIVAVCRRRSPDESVQDYFYFRFVKQMEKEQHEKKEVIINRKHRNCSVYKVNV